MKKQTENYGYDSYKKKLIRNDIPTQNFTRDFYNTFLNYRLNMYTEREEKYKRNLFSMDFYSESGYTEFVAIYNDSLPKYRIDFYSDSSPYWNCLERRLYEHFETEGIARRWAERYQKSRSLTGFIEINRVASGKRAG